MKTYKNRRVAAVLYVAAASLTLLTGFHGLNEESIAAETVTGKNGSKVSCWNIGETAGDAPEEAVSETVEAAEEAQKEYVRQQEEARKAEEEAKRIAEEKAAAEAAAQAEKKLLAALIFCEAGNQPYEGQVAVGAVVMNRVRSDSYPGTIQEVIYQSGQFTPAMTGWLDSVLEKEGYTESAMQAAVDALAGSNPVGDCLYFSTGGYGTKIGDHYFH